MDRGFRFAESLEAGGLGRDEGRGNGFVRARVVSDGSIVRLVSEGVPACHACEGGSRSCVGRPGDRRPVIGGLVEHPVPLGELTQDLEALKLRLAGLEAEAISPEDTAAMAQAISSIRLQLKRLRLDQAAMTRAVRQLDD